MDTLLMCGACGHSGPGHNGSGCSRCSCAATKEDVIENGLDAARAEIRALWKDPNWTGK